ncbi:MAG: dihydropyrimidinase [Chloroflexota bacterium]|nr:dihydropyrimidinase [Chloroflexota bacterium]
MTIHGGTQHALLIRGGTVVTAGGSRQADVAVDASGRIVTVEPRIAGSASREVDGTGLLVLPGVIDVHTHTRIASDAEPDRFFQDSVAAAFGGTTTFLSFNNPGTGISEPAQGRLRDGIDEWLDRTTGDSAIDYGLSAVITAQQDDPVADLPAAVARGVPTLKAFMVYDFGVDEAKLRQLLAATRDLCALLQVHCEDRALLEAGIRGQVAQGRTAPAFHADSRPTACEATGTGRGLAIAREVGAPIYAVHVSCADAMAPIAAAKGTGEPVFAETCPHYLALDSSRYALPDDEAIRCVISPPLRDRIDVDALWKALADGTLDLVATDHVPDRLAVEKRYAGQAFPEISNGAPGIETLLAVVHGKGVAEGRITLERMVDVLSTTPARLFGLAGKGSIEAGKDADLVLFDPVAQRTLRAEDLHHTSDYTPYEGMSVRGAVRDVFVRGQDVIRDGAFVGRRGFGRFQERRLDWR